MRPGTPPIRGAKPRRECESPCAIESGRRTAGTSCLSKTDHESSCPSHAFLHRKASGSIAPEVTEPPALTCVGGFDWERKHHGSSEIAALPGFPLSGKSVFLLHPPRRPRRVDKKKRAKHAGP